MKDILVVDDSAVVRKIVRIILTNKGFNVREVENNRQAYEACVEQMPDGIFLDACTPIMSGIDFLESFSKLTKEKEPRILYTCCEINSDEIQKALSLGAHDYMAKPFNAEILTTKFANIGIN